jgi:hypothetical protein
MLGPLTLATDAVKYPEFKTEQQARAFLKRCGLLKKTRVLEGKEREKMFTMLKLMPSESSNNQHLWCETWMVGEVMYEHITGGGVDELVETIEDDI